MGRGEFKTTTTIRLLVVTPPLQGPCEFGGRFVVCSVFTDEVNVLYYSGLVGARSGGDC